MRQFLIPNDCISLREMILFNIDCMGTKLFYGLGNPGEEYEGTRHNLGEVVLRSWLDEADLADSVKVRSLLPTIQMNNSGIALQNYLRMSPVEIKDILVIHDDMEMPLGDVQLVKGGSAKGHNGVRSIHDVLGSEDVPRLRLGVGRPPEGVDPRDFVLGRFNKEEQQVVDSMVQKVMEVLSRIAQDEL